MARRPPRPRGILVLGFPDRDDDPRRSPLGFMAMKIPRRLALLMMLPFLAATPARAGEWQCHREYYRAEIRQAEAEAELDCSRSEALIERQRARLNWTPAVYMVPYRPRPAVLPRR